MRKTTGTVTRKLYIKTYGCQMNVYDSGRMAEVLAPLGYAETGTVEEADMILLNTCNIREKAAEKLFSDLGRLRPLKARKAEDGGRLVLAVAGCVAQAEGAEILSRAPFVDLVLGPQTYHRLPEMVAKLLRGEGPVLDTEFPAEPKFDFLPRDETPQGIAAPTGQLGATTLRPTPDRHPPVTAEGGRAEKPTGPAPIVAAAAGVR